MREFGFLRLFIIGDFDNIEFLGLRLDFGLVKVLFISRVLLRSF